MNRIAKDKEFKAKNRDSNYGKQSKEDVLIGRYHQKRPEPTAQTTSKRNRQYQRRQEPAKEPFTQPESTTQQPESAQAVPQQEPENYPEPTDTEPIPEDTGREPQQPEPSRGAGRPTNRQRGKSAKAKQRKQAQKARQQRAAAEAVRQRQEGQPSEPDNTDHSFAPAKKPPRTEQYDLQAAVQEKKQTFDRVEKNTDFQLGRKTAEERMQTSGESDKPTRPQRKKRLYTEQAKRTAADKETAKAADQTDQSQAQSPKADNRTGAKTPEGETRKSGDFQFKRAERYAQKADRKQEKAEAAEAKLPKKKRLKRKRLYDEQKKKPKNRLQFEETPRPFKDGNRYTLVKQSAAFAGREALHKTHTKVRETEQENTAVEASHKAEQKGERLAQYSIRTAKNLRQSRNYAPYKKAARLRHRADKAQVKAKYEKLLAEHPELKKSAVKRFMQKQQIKKQYQAAKRGEQTTKAAAAAVRTTGQTARRITAFAGRHKSLVCVVLAVGLLIGWVGSLISSCSVMGTIGADSLMVSSYFAEDEDIYAAEDYYLSLERDLQARIDNIENEYPGYDEYSYNTAGIGHNPYALISCLTALYLDFTYPDIQPALDDLFASQYHLTITETSEERTAEDGSAYTYRTLNVTLTNSGFAPALDSDQREFYDIYLETKGNRDYLFADDIYANQTEPPGYTIPGEALSDETFRRLITEAEKYLGYPYVWGGSSPATSFDCSGFVCWVFQNSGVYPLSRTTAQGIYNQCAIISPAEAKPGDIIFFTGTYSTSDAVTHVGIYVGNGMMIHCGNPIQYASVNSSYWTSHFYAYGRLGGR